MKAEEVHPFHKSKLHWDNNIMGNVLSRGRSVLRLDQGSYDISEAEKQDSFTRWLQDPSKSPPKHTVDVGMDLYFQRGKYDGFDHMQIPTQ